MSTLEKIIKKLGFDPLNPPKRKGEDSWLIDDNTPSPYSVLTIEELNYLIGVVKEKAYS